MEIPLRVDFAGTWLDVPEFARKDGMIVNCAITPMVSLEKWPYKRHSGIGGSAARMILEGRGVYTFATQLGWQDAAIIFETGICSWASGPMPRLISKWDPTYFLAGRMALFWTGEHTAGTPDELAKIEMDYQLIVDAAKLANMALRLESKTFLRQAIELSYSAQIHEGMKPLPRINGTCCKYCGMGWGGYALYLFEDPIKRNNWVQITDAAMLIEPAFSHRWESRNLLPEAPCREE